MVKVLGSFDHPLRGFFTKKACLCYKMVIWLTLLCCPRVHGKVGSETWLKIVTKKGKNNKNMGKYSLHAFRGSESESIFLNGTFAIIEGDAKKNWTNIFLHRVIDTYDYAFLCLYTQRRYFENSNMVNWTNLVQKLTKNEHKYLIT